jgi:hypothetical protein
VAVSVMLQRVVVVWKQPQHAISRCSCFCNATTRCGRFFPINERFRSLSVTPYILTLLTVHFNIFISVFNQLDAQNLFHSKFYFMPLHVSSTCAHRQEVKIALHSLWYHHAYRCDDTRGCVMQLWPPDDEHMCSKHVEAWNKTYRETNLVHQVG